MANADSSSNDTDWPAVFRQLEGDRESIPWPHREAILPLDWRPATTPTPELMAVVELLASDPKWQVRRRAAATLVWLPEPSFSRLTAGFSADENAYVRRDADRALDKRRRGEKDSLSKGERSGELAAEYSSERVFKLPENRKTATTLPSWILRSRKTEPQRCVGSIPAT